MLTCHYFTAVLQNPGVSTKAPEPRIDKITVSGPGVDESGVVGEFDATFHVNTAGAGPGRLGVKVKGPKGEGKNLVV